jgi:hypothetical protein
LRSCAAFRKYFTAIQLCSYPPCFERFGLVTLWIQAGCS